MKSPLFFAVIALIGMITSTQAVAHGEDNPGPHGGYIRMPGAFHTEVVQVGKNEIKIYLLDLTWSNPEVLKSKVEVTHLETRQKAKCSTKDDYFHCVFKKSLNLKLPGKISVNAVRMDQKGALAEYSLPLSFKPTKAH